MRNTRNKGKSFEEKNPENNFDMDEHKKQKKIAVHNIRRIQKSIEDKTISCEPFQLQCRLDILTQYIDTVMLIQDSIDAIHYDSAERANLEDLCVSTKASLLWLLDNQRRPSSTSVPHNIDRKSKSLPNMKLPKFSGKYAEFRNFIGMFESLVDNDASLSGIEKFNHLLSCLSDEALGTVKTYQLTEENYPKALASLKSVYDNKCLIFFDTISKLFEVPQALKPSASGIRSLVDTFSAIYESLLSVGDEQNISNAIFIHLAMSKVDATTRSKWEETLDYNKLPTWSDCKAMLNRRFQHLSVEESSSTKHNVTAQNIKNQNNSSGGRRSKQSSLSVAKGNEMPSKTNTHDNKCFYCKASEHSIYSCSSFSSLSIADRYKFVENFPLCTNCLRRGHNASRCRSSKCRVCQGAHNTVLHKYSTEPNQSVRSLNTIQQPGSAVSINHATFAEECVVLATAVVKIRNASGEFILARALLDSGSQVNCMTEELANTLSLHKKSNFVPIAGIGNANQKVRHSVCTMLQSRFNLYNFESEYLVMKSISTYHPDRLLPVEKWNIPKNIELADPLFYNPQRVDILIGAETFFDLLCVGQIKVEPRMPTIQKTLLGWIVSGKYTTSVQTYHKSCLLLNSSDTNFDLHSFVKKFWEFEELPTTPAPIKLTKEHQECENKFLQSIKRSSTGRIQVSLPFKAQPSLLGASFEIAKRRFLSLERKLEKNPEMHKLYMDFMTEYLHLGHMSPTSKEIPSGPHYYIPHQCVLRPSSTSTKLRVVFDASSKTSSQVALNDILMVGPTIQPDLYATILSFRLHKFAIIADITKMYRQFEIDEADRIFQLVLWRKSPLDPIQTFSLNTVTYGTSPAPFLAIRCLKYLSEIYTESHPIGSRVVANNFYVDDLLTGAETLEDLEIIRSQVTEILVSAGLQLAKWHSNHSSYADNRTERPLKVNDYAKTLGIIWIPEDDTFNFQLDNDFDHLSPTKRNILSISSRLFDPLGLLAPFVVRSKMLLQELWLNDLQWDESIPQRLATCWQNFKADLTLLNSIKIPRFVQIYSTAEIEIHGFADASVRAYGCCIYIRSVTPNGIYTNLLTAKSRVAPLKTRSLPRLELCAVHLLAKLWSTVRPLLKFTYTQVVFWTDSEITLYWLQSLPSTLNTFVANRVAETQELTENVKWLHVPSKSNPADLVSRGCRVEDLKTSIWFTGPEFLLQEPELWPKNKKLQLKEEQLTLEKRKTQVAFVAAKLENNVLLDLIDRISSYMKLVRTFAYILRAFKFKKSTRQINSETALSSQEIKVAFLKIIQVIQKDYYATEFHQLKNSKTLSPRYQKLNLFVHNFEEGGFEFSLIRVGGRLLNAPIPYDARFPLLLPQCTFVEIYLRHLHIKNFHAGAKVLMGLLRQEIWIINAREQCTKIVRRCVHCFKYKPKLLNQIMGNLPTDRVTSCRPFLISGVDLCGPVNVTLKIRGKPPVKMYIAVFVCFSTKAIHLETITDLSSDCFILCLKRFISRRGLPRKLFCDNATNFVGAQRKLKELKEAFDCQKDRLETYAAQEGMEFAFIPPRAPHFGGLWEAGVKSAKTLLVKAIGKMLPTTEELQTILVEIEAILNSRPLAPLSNDPNDGEALTPAHLLHGEMLRSLPHESIPSVDEDKIPLLKRWQQLSAVKTGFWKAWSRDYLLTLQQRTQWSKEQPNLVVGKLVLIHEDNLRPQHWLTGRVIKIFIGGDSKVRVANVKTAKAGVLKRPIAKLAVLPID